MEPLDDVEDELRQKAFYTHVREYIISLLLVVSLYLLSYAIVSRLQRHRSNEDCYSSEDDAVVYRIATWLCSFAVCVSIGSVLLLPVSIVANEILVHYPDSYYMQWLNTSLISGLWNQAFLGCNACLFLLLPFAYLFTESEGLAGSRKGIMSRVYETVILLVLLVILAIGFAWLLTAVFTGNYEQAPHNWLSYIPFLYSVVSMLGVLLMSVCTPLGFSCLFTVLSKIITAPKVHTNVEEELELLRLEEAALRRRERIAAGRQRLTVEDTNNDDALNVLHARIEELDQHVRSSPWERRLLYPLSFLSLLLMTILAFILVCANCVCLTFDPSSMPGGNSIQGYLGNESTSHLGALGATLEVAIIIYFMCASVVGFYSTPLFSQMLPTLHGTSMTKVMGNCIVLLVLSSALPLMARTLGITTFNLLGRFGSFEWLGNFWLVLSYNLLFSAITVVVLFKRVSRAVLNEISAMLGTSSVTLRLWHARPQKSPPKYE